MFGLVDVQLQLGTMTSTRKEVFAARVIELGLAECMAAMTLKGVDTYRSFAFGCEYTPQHPRPEVLDEKLLAPIAANDATRIPSCDSSGGRRGRLLPMT